MGLGSTVGVVDAEQVTQVGMLAGSAGGNGRSSKWSVKLPMKGISHSTNTAVAWRHTVMPFDRRSPRLKFEPSSGPGLASASDWLPCQQWNPLRRPPDRILNDLPKVRVEGAEQYRRLQAVYDDASWKRDRTLRICAPFADGTHSYDSNPVQTFATSQSPSLRHNNFCGRSLASHLLRVGNRGSAVQKVPLRGDLNACTETRLPPLWSNALRSMEYDKRV